MNRSLGLEVSRWGRVVRRERLPPLSENAKVEQYGSPIKSSHALRARTRSVTTVHLG